MCQLPARDQPLSTSGLSHKVSWVVHLQNDMQTHFKVGMVYIYVPNFIRIGLLCRS